MRRPPLRTALFAAALTASGCASMSYQPRNTPFLKPVQIDGVQHFRVGDRDFSGGLVGGLDEAVAEVPEAHAHAEEAASDALTGLILTIVGAVLVGLGTAGMAANTDGVELYGADSSAISVGFMVGGAATTLGAVFELASASAHQIDAINIFNDTMWLRSLGDLPAPGAPAEAPPRAP